LCCDLPWGKGALALASPWRRKVSKDGGPCAGCKPVREAGGTQTHQRSELVGAVWEGGGTGEVGVQGAGGWCFCGTARRDCGSGAAVTDATHTIARHCGPGSGSGAAVTDATHTIARDCGPDPQSRGSMERNRCVRFRQRIRDCGSAGSRNKPEGRSAAVRCWTGTVRDNEVHDLRKATSILDATKAVTTGVEITAPEVLSIRAAHAH
jgi:hypothetical protein